MLGIVDYGVGNLFSLCSSLSKIGIDSKICSRPSELKDVSKLILPGVGAFGDAVDKLHKTGLFDEILNEAKKGKPILGICLGMQLLFNKSYEFGEHDGLGLIEGEVRPLKEILPREAKIPHIGWNEISFYNHALFNEINQNSDVYFVHSFYGIMSKNVIATTDYYEKFTAAVAKDTVMGCQFHPEKSGKIGLKILKNFCEM